ncbi:MAG: hypothetical protein NT070_02710 [Cyanobacteria bacterium]|nr:hypothetical protein [Cyanobacteriota bacterium]
MAQICLEVSDELLERLNQNGYNPNEFFQARLVGLSTSINAVPLDQKFVDLAAQWRHETRHLSLMSDIVINTAYQKIIGMGDSGGGVDFAGSEATARSLVLGVAIDYRRKSSGADRSGTSGRDGDGLVRVGSSEWISMLS